MICTSSLSYWWGCYDLNLGFQCLPYSSPDCFCCTPSKGAIPFLVSAILSASRGLNTERRLHLRRLNPTQSQTRGHSRGRARTNFALVHSCSSWQRNNPQVPRQWVGPAMCCLLPSHVVLDLFLVLKPSRSAWPIRIPGLGAGCNSTPAYVNMSGGGKMKRDSTCKVASFNARHMGETFAK